MDLEKLRKEINVIDDEIIVLFLKRMETVKKIAEEKNSQKIPLTDSIREKAIKERILLSVSDDMKVYTEELIEKLIELSKEYQTTLKVTEKTK